MGLVSALQVDTGDGDGAWPGGGRGFRAEPIAPVTDRDSPIGVRVIVTMRTEDLPAEDRFEWWFEQVSKDTAPTVVSSPHAGDFRAAVTLADLGPVRLTVLTYPETRSVRTAALIRRSDPERHGLFLTTQSALWISQRDRCTRVGTGDLSLFDTSQPYDFQALPGADPGKALMLHFPKTALPVRPERLQCLLAGRLPTDTGMNAIFARYLISVASALEQGEVSEPETGRLGEVALDLATAVLAARVGAQDRLPPETRQQILVSRIEAFIERNLGDPGLTPAVIAAHHHVSLGHLHRIFQPRELTVAAWIRHQRLECCRADLTDPRLRGMPVHAIGARWGFRSPTDFSRAFRAAHGIPPGDYRRQMLAAGRTADAE
jgi:AraC-like DNA-binding protein